MPFIEDIGLVAGKAAASLDDADILLHKEWERLNNEIMTNLKEDVGDDQPLKACRMWRQMREGYYDRQAKAKRDEHPSLKAPFRRDDM